jgi:SOS response associated peptidase (SRAP)
LRTGRSVSTTRRWGVDRDSGSQLHTFTIITTRANALVRRIHDRMPVIFDTAMGSQWLEGPFGARAMALDLVLQPLPSERMAAHEVSTLVNSPENDTAECLQPVSPGQPIKRQLPLLSQRVHRPFVGYSLALCVAIHTASAPVARPIAKPRATERSGSRLTRWPASSIKSSAA